MNTPSHRKERNRQLETIDNARRELEKASTVEQIKAIREDAEFVRTRAQQSSLGIEVQNLAAELKLQAERLGGQFLTQLKLRGKSRSSSRRSGVLRLKDLGIDKNQSARWQLEATVPEPIFRDFVRAAHSAGREISSAALLRLARNLRRGRLDEVMLGSSRHAVELGVQPVSIKSHLMSVNWSEPEPTSPGLSELLDIVNEILNHHATLMLILDSVCQQANLDFSSTDYRAVHRYMDEMKGHLHVLIATLNRMDSDPLFQAMANRAAPC